MTREFKDHFSGHAADYRSYRPTYPHELYQYLSSLGVGHRRAWDCATGSGQAAIGLAAYFDEVIATDASSAQIDNADAPDNVVFKVAPAEQSGLDPRSVDLIAVAQALHWFDLDAFKSEVDRVLVPDGILAVWSYGLATVDARVDEIVNHLYRSTLDEFWPPERKRVEAGYAQVEFPYQLIESPRFAMTADWTLVQLVGYIDTWSAVKQYIKTNGVNPVEQVLPQLQSAWGDGRISRTVSWPLTLLVWRKPA